MQTDPIGGTLKKVGPEHKIFDFVEATFSKTILVENTQPALTMTLGPKANGDNKYFTLFILSYKGEKTFPFLKLKRRILIHLLW